VSAMPVENQSAVVLTEETVSYRPAPNWLYNLRLLWDQRILLVRVAGIAFVLSAALVFVVPKTYISQARLMPPEMGGANSALYAALAGKALGSDVLGGLAASLMGGRNSGALFIDLLRSSSVAERMIDRFDLLKVYHKRYRVDAEKALARRTNIVQDKKSGVLMLTVKDTDPKRARDMAQAYLDELNTLVLRTNNSSARQERLFIEKRLQAVKGNLERAQEAMSEFSSTHAAIDLREQARATVESEAKVQGELIAAQAELESLRQVYGDANIRVRGAEARIGELKRELEKMGGSSAPLPTVADEQSANQKEDRSSYLPLRQVPRLAVPYADLYREVHVQETVYDLLTQQYEMARIQEAKDVPAVSVIDAPAIPEKKSFPPRAILALALTMASVLAASLIVICRRHWLLIDPSDPRRAFAREIFESVRVSRPSGRARSVAS
jgi:capsule polysaccharide export protein KpsE/RkpR